MVQVSCFFEWKCWFTTGIIVWNHSLKFLSNYLFILLIQNSSTATYVSWFKQCMRLRWCEVSFCFVLFPCILFVSLEISTSCKSNKGQGCQFVVCFLVSWLFSWTDLVGYFAASLLLGTSEGRSDKASRQRSDSPFLFPRQKRSVRQRLYLSIDSESE